MLGKLWKHNENVFSNFFRIYFMYEKNIMLSSWLYVCQYLIEDYFNALLSISR